MSLTHKRPKKINDPYTYLLLGIIKQAFSDSSCYLLQRGTKVERKNGIIAIAWMKNREQTFNLISEAFENQPYNIDRDRFYRMCMNILIKMERHVYEN